MQKKNSKKINTGLLTELALLTALALAVYGAESALPALLPIPGLRLGLSNIITLAVLRRNGARSAALVLTARILLAALLFGQPVSLLYSLSGGFLCLLSEILIDHILRKNYLFLTSAFGGLIHNLGQLLAARLIMGSPAVWLYLPYLIPAGILTGLFVGLCAHFLLKLLPSRPADSRPQKTFKS